VAPILFKTISENLEKGMKFKNVATVTVKIAVLGDVTTCILLVVRPTRRHIPEVTTETEIATAALDFLSS
jgi:hypothetical protein